MLKAIAFGLSVGAGVQAFRNWPADGPVSTDMAALVLVVAVACAYLGGRARRGSASATAVAVAEAHAAATAQQAVQVFVGQGTGYGARPVGLALPTDNAPWLAGSGERPALSLDQIDGMDLSELTEEAAEDRAG